jgi:hypothetical protein
MADMASKNRAASGEENYHAKLKEDDIQKIRSSTLSTYKLAAKFGISQTQIRRVKDGTHWSTK